MSIGSLLKKVWMNPLAKGAEVDDGNSVGRHRKILQSNPFLRANYHRWYGELDLALHETESLNGPVVEVGCGASFLEERVPALVKTDSVPNPFAHRQMDAMAMDFPSDSIRAIYLSGVLHHIPDPGKFLSEAERCLQSGGRLVMIEPNNSPIERLLCRYLDHYEYFDDTVEGWVNSEANSMTNANLAIPWVIFFRDRALFEKRFPRLSLKRVRYHTFLAYFISGGMTYKPFLPRFCVPLVNAMEYLFTPFMRVLGTTMTVELVKR